MKKKEFVSKNGVTKITLRKHDGSHQEVYAKVPSKRHGKVVTLVDAKSNAFTSFYADEVESIKKDARLDYGVRMGKVEGRNVVAKFKTRKKANLLRYLSREASILIMESELIVK
jgi:hypothetical protein